jgi:hypothetical protein
MEIQLAHPGPWPPREPLVSPGVAPHQPPPYGPPPYGPPPYGPPPFGPPPQGPEEKPFWKRTWVRVVTAIFVVAVISSAMSDGQDEPAPTASDAADASAAAVEPVDEPAPTEKASPETVNPRIGQPAADGDFSFVVSGVECGLTEIGGEYFGTEAQGQFCVVSLSVTNIGDSAQTFDGDYATLFNTEGQEFSADTGAAFSLEDSSSFYEDINPGNTLNSKIVFDVPAGATLTHIELHDSMFSGGVTVSLE